MLVVSPGLMLAEGETALSSLGIQYLAGTLRAHGYRTEIIDACLEGLDAEGLAERIRGYRPKVLGVSLASDLVLESAIATVVAVRRAHPQTLVIFGGMFPTLSPELLLARHGDQVDVVVRGEGEHVLLALVRAHLAGQCWTELPGIAWRDSLGKVHMTARSKLIAELDRLPFPARDSTALALAKGGAIPMSSSRGCPFNCTFCSIVPFFKASDGPLWRARSAKNVVDEIQEVTSTLECEDVQFVDDNFMGSSHRGAVRAQELAEEILRRGVSVNFSIEARADDIVAHEDVVALLKRAGLSRVFMGLESGSQAALDRCRKQLALKDSYRALSILEAHEILVTFGFMILDPKSSIDEFDENVAFLSKVSPHHLWSLPNIAQMYVYHGTPVHAQMDGDQRLKGSFTRYSYEMRDVAMSRLRDLIDDIFDALVPAYAAVRSFLFESKCWRQQVLLSPTGQALRGSALGNLALLNRTSVEFLKRLSHHIRHADPAEDMGAAQALRSEVDQRCQQIVQAVLLSRAFFLDPNGVPARNRSLGAALTVPV